MKPSLFLLLLFIGLGLSAQNCSNVSLDFPYGNADTLKLCQGQIEINLGKYASISGGMFSGQGISGQKFKLELVSVGIFEVMYIVGNDTCIKHIEVSPLSFEFPSTAETPTGFLELTTCTSDPPVDFSGYVSPAGGTFSGPGMIGSIFNPALVPPDSLLTISYSLDTLQCNKIEQINLREGPIGYIAEILFPTSSFACGGGPTNQPLIPLVANLAADLNPALDVFRLDGILVTNDTINPNTLSIGEHVLSYAYQEDACNFFDTLRFTIVAPPNYTLNSQLDFGTTAFCKNSGLLSLPKVLEGIETYTSNDLIITPDGHLDSDNSPVGQYDLFYSITDSTGGCSLMDTFTIDLLESVNLGYEQIPLECGATSFCKNVGLLSLPKILGDRETYTSNDLIITDDGQLDSDNSPAGQYDLFYSIIDPARGCLMDTFTINLLESANLEYELILSNCEDIADSLLYIGALSLQGIEPLITSSDYRIISNNANKVLLIDWDYPGEYYIDISTAQVGCLSDVENIELFIAPRLDDTCAVSIYLPNAFTPNTDNKNDLFFIQGRNIEQASLFIYDRWGALVFESNEMTVGWNGNSPDGTPLETGVYFYYAEVTYRDGKTILTEGDVTLIR